MQHEAAKKQGATSHSSSEAEVIALDAALRMEGIPALMLWDIIMEVYHPEISATGNCGKQDYQWQKQQRLRVIDYWSNVEQAPQHLHDPKYLSEII